jgi:drug/metabolite transporter (DMT)-like permease
MPSGLLHGLAAAVAWGFTDVAGALSGRRFGSLAVLVATSLTGLVLLSALALLTGTPLAMSPSTALEAALCGVIANIAYLAFFTALRMGPISVVSPTVAAYGGLTVVLAVLVREETLTPTQALGAAIATAGVVMTGLVFDGGVRNARLVGPGVWFAIVALVSFAIVTVWIAGPIRDAGWLPVAIVSRGSNALLSTVMLAAALVFRPPFAAPLLRGGKMRSRRWLLVLPLTGLLDAAGMVAFAIGLEQSLVWAVGLASSFGPVVAVIVAVGVMGERLRPAQWLGLAGIAAGLVTVGLP